jgi:hypothetical protein
MLFDDIGASRSTSLLDGGKVAVVTVEGDRVG